MSTPEGNHTETGRAVNILRAHLSKDDNVLFALLFGSYAAGRQKKRSDVDLALCFKTPPCGLVLFSLINRLSNICGADVDLVVLNRASPLLKHQVMKQGILLDIKDRLAYRQFRETVISGYEEYKYVSGMAAYD